jgi:hypothetical protein
MLLLWVMGNHKLRPWWNYIYIYIYIVKMCRLGHKLNCWKYHTHKRMLWACCIRVRKERILIRGRKSRGLHQQDWFLIQTVITHGTSNAVYANCVQNQITMPIYVIWMYIIIKYSQRTVKVPRWNQFFLGTWFIFQWCRNSSLRDTLVHRHDNKYLVNKAKLMNNFS